jgi:dihydroxyacetone kinase
MPLDDELASLYDAPCETPGFRLPAGGTLASGGVSEAASLTLDVSSSASSIRELDDTDPDAGGIAAAALTAALGAVTEHEDELGRLDAVAADGDHGQGIVRGMRAAVAAARTSGAAGDTAGDVGTALLAAGTALADAAGGASGALFGVLLTETGGRLQPHGDRAVTTSDLADAVTAAQGAVTGLGGAHPGDKTMVDALDSFTRSLRDHAESTDSTSRDVAAAWRQAAEQARTAAERTADLTPAVGRAARLGDRGRGSPDPGATSFALMAVAAGGEITARCGEENR